MEKEKERERERERERDLMSRSRRFRPRSPIFHSLNPRSGTKRVHIPNLFDRRMHRGGERNDFRVVRGGRERGRGRGRGRERERGRLLGRNNINL